MQGWMNLMPDSYYSPLQQVGTRGPISEVGVLLYFAGRRTRGMQFSTHPTSCRGSHTTTLPLRFSSQIEEFCGHTVYN